MQRALRPWITASVALTGASIVAVTPVAPPRPDVQERSVRLTSGSSAIFGDLTGAVDQALGKPARTPRRAAPLGISAMTTRS